MPLMNLLVFPVPKSRVASSQLSPELTEHTAFVPAGCRSYSWISVASNSLATFGVLLVVFLGVLRSIPAGAEERGCALHFALSSEIQTQQVYLRSVHLLRDEHAVVSEP